MNIQKSYKFVFNVLYLVPWGRVLFNSSSASPKRFPALNGTHKFTTALTVPFTCPCREPGTCIPFLSYSFKIYFNIRSSISRSSKWVLSLWFPHQKPEFISVLSRRVASHSSWFDHSNNPRTVVILNSVLIWYPVILSYYPKSLVTNVIFK